MRPHGMTTSMIVRVTAAVVALFALVAVALASTGAATTTVRSSGPGAASDLASQAVDPATGSAVFPAQAQRTSRPSALQGDDSSDDEDSSDDVTLTLLHNNDGESKLLPDPDAGFPGIARFAAAWIDLGTSTDADILVRVSAGDNFLASKEFSASLARDDAPLYDSIALRGLYEAVSLGNHDFDFGPDVTARFIQDFQLGDAADPVVFVSSNVDVSGEPALAALVDQGRLAPSTVYTDPTSGLDVGIIGAITPRLANISSPGRVRVDAQVADAVNAQVQALQDQGVNRIILVSHLQGLAEDRALLPQLSGIDIVVAGGGDELLKNAGDSCLPDETAMDTYPLLATDADGNDVPIVTAPGGYRCIGRLDVTFDADGVITDIDGESIGVPVDGPAEDFARARVEEPLQEAVAELEATVIAASEVALDGRRSTVRTTASNEGELLADALLWTARETATFGSPRPQIAVQNGGGIRNDSVIADGDITLADTFDIAPFANFVVSGEISRQRLKDLLEVAVAGLPEAAGTFPQVAGMRVEIDAGEDAQQVDFDGDCSLSGDPGGRIRSVTLDDGTEIVRDGQVVAGDDVTLATIDFLANGGDCYPLGDLAFRGTGTSYQQALASYIQDELDGVITADAYPPGGTRLIVTDADDSIDDSIDAADAEGDGDADRNDDTAADDSDGAEDRDEADDADQDEDEADDASEAEDEEPLPTTGLESWFVLIVALTGVAAGGLIFVEAQRAGRLSLANRLRATRAWFPDDDS